MTASPDRPTLQQLARSLPGAKAQMIHQDLARLGYLEKLDGAWRITPQGDGLFVYQQYTENWNPTVRPTEQGEDCILQHYLDDELTMYPLSDEFGPLRSYNTGRVIKLAIERWHLLTIAEQNMVDALSRKLISEHDACNDVFVRRPPPTYVHDKIALLGAKLEERPLSEYQQKWCEGWRHAPGRYTGTPTVPPLKRSQP